jgi:peptidoglycan/LPS O-acetylase OafA/YrhL
MTAAKKPRDIRLDFFRGLALAAIFVAHVPGDWLAQIIWARFGLSDAAHVFVFISGYAAAIAFCGTFVRDGLQTHRAPLRAALRRPSVAVRMRRRLVRRRGKSWRRLCGISWDRCGFCRSG